MNLTDLYNFVMYTDFYIHPEWDYATVTFVDYSRAVTIDVEARTEKEAWGKLEEKLRDGLIKAISIGIKLGD